MPTDPQPRDQDNDESRELGRDLKDAADRERAPDATQTVDELEETIEEGANK